MIHVIKMLREDHKKVKSLFKEYGKIQKDSQLGRKSEIAQLVFRELTIHTQIEEDHLYPFGLQNSDEKGKLMVLEAIEEHRVVKDLIEQLKNTDVSDAQFDATFKVMQENVEHHIEEEESDLFPKLEKKLKEEDEQMSEQMVIEKQYLLHSLAEEGAKA